jgi:sugar lactone lactonase YvrE
VAFVHALDLAKKFPVCIDLPSGDGDFEKLKQYTLALGRDGATLYAANTALGVVAEVNLSTFSVTRQARLPASAGSGGAALSALSHDGQMLYFAGEQEVWPYATQTGAVLTPYRVEATITGLGVSGDGRRLYVAQAARPLLVLDTATRRAVDLEAARVASP